MIHKQFGWKNFFKKGKVWTDLEKQNKTKKKNTVEALVQQGGATENLF